MSEPRHRSLIVFSMVAVVAALAVMGWVSDFITLQGERTIYTVGCEGGAWQQDVCTGRLVAGARYRYRALRAHREVLFWRVGVAEPSGRLGACEIVDGRNWTCPRGADSARSITLTMDHGRAVHDTAPDAGPQFRAVSKWRWTLLQWGLPAGDSSDY